MRKRIELHVRLRHDGNCEVSRDADGAIRFKNIYDLSRSALSSLHWLDNAKLKKPIKISFKLHTHSEG